MAPVFTEEPAITEQARRCAFRWNGTVVEVRAALKPRQLFLIPQLRVLVDGREAATGSAFFHGQFTGEFAGAEERAHRVKVVAGSRLWFDWMPCSVSIDDDVLYNGAVPIQGAWGVFLFGALIAGAIIGGLDAIVNGVRAALAD